MDGVKATSAAHNPSLHGLSARGAGAASTSSARRGVEETACCSESSQREAAEGKSTSEEQATQQNAAGTSHSVDSESAFVCSICLTSPHQPVTTVCGHVYCWGCLFKWLNMHRLEPVCPVCKAGIEMPNGDPSKAKVIPLYVNGRSEPDPRSTIPEDPTIPSRPQTDRPPPQRFPNFQVPTQLNQNEGMRPASAQGAPLEQRDAAQQEFLSRILFMIGTFIALCLIFFP